MSNNDIVLPIHIGAGAYDSLIVQLLNLFFAAIILKDKEVISCRCKENAIMKCTANETRGSFFDHLKKI